VKIGVRPSQETSGSDPIFLQPAARRGAAARAKPFLRKVNGQARRALGSLKEGIHHPEWTRLSHWISMDALLTVAETPE